MAAKSRKNEKKGKDEPSTPSYAVPIDKSRASACQAGATNLSEQFSDKIIRPRDDPGFRQLFTQARHAHRLGCVTIGVNMLEEARELKQVSEHGLLSRSYCHFQVGDLNRAMTDVNTILSKDPDFDRALLLKAEILYASGKFETALIYFSKVIKSRPNMHGAKEGVRKTMRAIIEETNDLSKVIQHIMN